MANESFKLSQDDLVGVILADLKRLVREYATAATESNCANTRKMFTDLLINTLTMQGELFTVMSQNNMYEQPSVAQQKDITQQIQSYTQMQMKTSNWLQQGIHQGVLHGIASTPQGIPSNYQQQPIQ